jgi:glycosyltransferase involved in cell wall biosynthesis
MAYGGIETAVLNWLKTMDRSRFEVHLFCFANPGHTEAPFIEAANAAGFTVHCIRWTRSKPVLRAARELAEYVRRLRIEILHCHNTYAQLVAITTGWLTGVKTVTTIYVWGKFGWKRAVLQRIDQWSLRFLDQVSAHCETTFDETVRRGVPSNSLKLLVCGFDGSPVKMIAEDRDQRRAEFGASPRDTVLINVARFWPEKAHDVLLESFRRILQARPDAKLWLAGVGPEEPRIRALTAEKNLEHATRFLGFRPDLAEILALADIVVHPSDMEGVPLAVCSAMAAELPIVATGVGGLLEILRDGESAILVAPRQPERVAEAVLDLMQEAPKRRRLGMEAGRFIREDYSLSRATAAVEAVYEEMMKK